MHFRRAIQTGLLLALLGVPGIAAAQTGGGDGGSRPALRERIDVTGTVPRGGARLVRTSAFGRPSVDRYVAPPPVASRCAWLLCSGYMLLGIAY